jgi:prepilin-type N-terminal cleavage/methylation domain-containing protein
MTNDQNVSSFVIRHSNFRRRGAFTLVEIIVSIAIIAALLPPILYGLNLAAKVSSVARNRSQASILAQQKLDELLVNDPSTPQSGDFGDQYPQFTWSSDVLDRSDIPTVDNLTNTMQELDVTITWKQDGQPKTLTLGTLVYINNATSTGGAP